MKSLIAKKASAFLAVLAALIVTPFSAALIHQPKAPEELYKKK